MKRFECLCGLPGSGKDTFIERAGGAYGTYVKVSTDAIRSELYGDEGCQDNPAKVFEIAYSRIDNALNNGKSVVFNATNISAKKRKALLSRKSMRNVYKVCVVIVELPAICIARQNLRERKVPASVIKKMAIQFEMPEMYEGWDEIVFIPPHGYHMLSRDLESAAAIFDQRNPHHKLTVLEHEKKVRQFIKDNYKLEGYEEALLCAAATYHDCAKPYCQTFKDDEVAHYYGHQNLGWQLYLCMKPMLLYKERIFVARLIFHHMDYYCKTKNIEYLKKNDKTFFSFLEKLHCADANGKE